MFQTILGIVLGLNKKYMSKNIKYFIEIDKPLCIFLGGGVGGGWAGYVQILVIEQIIWDINLEFFVFNCKLSKTLPFL